MNGTSPTTKSIKALKTMSLALWPMILVGNSVVLRAIETHLHIPAWFVVTLCFVLFGVAFIRYAIAVWREAAEQREALDKKYAEADAYLFGPKGNTQTRN